RAPATATIRMPRVMNHKQSSTPTASGSSPKEFIEVFRDILLSTVKPAERVDDKQPKFTVKLLLGLGNVIAHELYAFRCRQRKRARQYDKRSAREVEVAGVAQSLQPMSQAARALAAEVHHEPLCRRAPEEWRAGRDANAQLQGEQRLVRFRRPDERCFGPLLDQPVDEIRRRVMGLEQIVRGPELDWRVGNGLGLRDRNDREVARINSSSPHLHERLARDPAAKREAVPNRAAVLLALVLLTER